jgi:anti-sigma B factor antagonist
VLNVELTIREVRGLAVVALGGELDLADTSAVASHLIAAAAACNSIVVDLSDLAFISCGGLGILLRTQKMTRALGGELLLVAPHGRVRAVLEVTGLIGVFSVYPTVRRALSVAAPARPRIAS